MKAIMILGANVGFILGISASLVGGCSWPVAIGHAGVTALVGGILGRWWGRVWFTELHSALEQRREREREHAEEKQKNQKPAKA